MHQTEETQGVGSRPRSNPPNPSSLTQELDDVVGDVAAVIDLAAAQAVDHLALRQPAATAAAAAAAALPAATLPLTLGLAAAWACTARFASQQRSCLLHAHATYGSLKAMTAATAKCTTSSHWGPSAHVLLQRHFNIHMHCCQSRGPARFCPHLGCAGAHPA